MNRTEAVKEALNMMLFASIGSVIGVGILALWLSDSPEELALLVTPPVEPTAVVLAAGGAE